MRKATENPARAVAWALLILGLALMWATSISSLGPLGTSLHPRAWTPLLVGLVGGLGSALLGFYLLQASLATGRLRIGERHSRPVGAGRYSEGEPSNEWADEQIT